MSDLLELRFRPTGSGRWFAAGFLSFWLLGWAAGEVFALSVLLGGVHAWISGRHLPGQPESQAAQLAIAAFLLVWLSGWTVGGVLALREWLGCFWAEDRLRLTRTDLECCRQLGPWRRQRRFPRAALRSVSLAWRRPGQARPLMAQLVDREVELTALGTPREREQAAVLLQRALGSWTATPEPPTRPQLPQGWACEEPGFSAALLVPCRRIRRQQALVMACVALPLDGLLVLLGLRLGRELALLPLVLMLALLATGASWAVLWLALGRREWRLESGTLVAQRRFAGRVRELFTARGLQLVESTDGDGDDWYALAVTDLHALPGGPAKLPQSVVLCRTIHDPGEPRALGLWLARRTRIGLDDQIPTEEQRQVSREAEVARLRQQLEASGRLGRWLARRLG